MSISLHLIVGLLTILFVAVILFLLYFLLFAPVGLPIFTLTSAFFSPFNTLSSHPSYSNLTFSIQKPDNRVRYLYDSLNVSIFHGFHLISNGSVRQISQKGDDHDPLKVPFMVVGVRLKKTVAEDLIQDLKRDGNASFRVRVAGRVKYGWIWHRNHFIRALCRNVPVGFASNKSVGVLLATRDCESRLCDSGSDGNSSCLNAV